MSRRLCILLLGVLPSACAFGLTTDRFKPANSPSGVLAEVRTAGAVFEGELVELREEALVLLSNETAGNGPAGNPPKQLLRLIPFRSIQRAGFEQLGPRVRIADGRTPSRSVRERLRFLSRFPYGMSEQVQAELLQSLGQTALAGAER